MGYRTPSLLYSNFPHAFGLMPDLTVFFPGCLYASTAVLLVCGGGGRGVTRTNPSLLLLFLFRFFFIIFLYVNFHINLKVSLHSSRGRVSFYLFIFRSHFLFMLCACVLTCVYVYCVCSIFRGQEGAVTGGCGYLVQVLETKARPLALFFNGNHITFLYYSEEINIFMRF